MGLFFKKKNKESTGVPPPPPPDENTGVGAEETKGENPEEIPELPPLGSEQHLKSDIPEIKPAKEEGANAPEFPEAPEEESAEEKDDEKPEEAEEHEEEEPEAAAEEVATRIVEAGPKFVTAATFQTVLTQADSIRDSIKETEETIRKIEGLKDAEQKELERWRSHIEDVEKKLNYIDKTIFKGA